MDRGVLQDSLRHLEACNAKHKADAGMHTDEHGRDENLTKNQDNFLPDIALASPRTGAEQQSNDEHNSPRGQQYDNKADSMMKAKIHVFQHGKIWIGHNLARQTTDIVPIPA